MIELHALGTLSLTDSAGPEVRSLLSQPRRFALFAYLAAATPRGLHRRDSLLAMFWPELDQDHARTALRQSLHVLRSALGAEVLMSRGDDEVGVDAVAVWTDVAAFDAACAAGASGALDAMNLYRGPLLEGFCISDAPEFERWLDAERARLQAAASRAARLLVDASQARGDFESAARWARRAIELAPHDESLVRRLIVLLDGQGDRAGALQVFEAFTAHLAKEYEATPAPETSALIAAVRERERPLSVVTLRDGEELGATSAAAASRAQSKAPPRLRFQARLMIAVAVSLMALVAAGAWRARAAPAAGNWIRSVAVLPLANLSGDAGQDGFAEGMTSALITDLGRVHALRVISHHAVIPYEGTTKSSQTIGRALVEGSVQRSADTFRIDVRMLDALTGKQLWAQRFQDAVEHRFAVQDSITRRVLAALNVSMTAAEGRRLRTPPTTNPEAYDLFLRGRIRIRKETRANDSIAIGYFQRAVALDPAFAVAHAWLGKALGERVAQFAPNDTSALEQAFLEVEKAVRLDPDLAEAHYAKATLLWGTTRNFAHEQAVREDQRALALDPSLEVAHHHLGMIYGHIGLLDEAVQEFQKTLALDPEEWLALQRLGNARFLQGHRDEALRIMRQVPSTTNPSLWTYHYGRELIATGRMSEAAALIDQYLQQHPDDPGGVVTSLRAILSAKRGDPRAAEADIQLAQVKGKGFIHFHHTAYNIATAYALLHQPDLALAWLKRTAAEGWPIYTLFASDPDLDAIRKQPAFIAFLAEQRSQWERFRQLARSG